MFINPYWKCLQYLAECVSNTSVEVDEISETVLNIEMCRLGKILGKQMPKWVQVKRVQLFIMFKRILFFFTINTRKPPLPLSQMLWLTLLGVDLLLWNCRWLGEQWWQLSRDLKLQDFQPGLVLWKLPTFYSVQNKIASVLFCSSLYFKVVYTLSRDELIYHEDSNSRFSEDQWRYICCAVIF